MAVHEENDLSVKLLVPKPSVSSTMGVFASIAGANFNASGQSAFLDEGIARIAESLASPNPDWP